MKRVLLDGKPVSPQLERALLAEMKRNSGTISVVDDESKLQQVIEMCENWRSLGTRSLYVGGMVYAAEMILKSLGLLSFPENVGQPDSRHSEDSLT